jgi:hypothetical protein
MLANFDNTQKEILYRHRVNVSAHSKRCTITIGPASKVQQRRFKALNLLNKGTAPPHLFLASCPQSFKHMQVQGVLISFLGRATHNRIALFMQEINDLLGCL